MKNMQNLSPQDQTPGFDLMGHRNLVVGLEMIQSLKNVAFLSKSRKTGTCLARFSALLTKHPSRLVGGGVEAFKGSGLGFFQALRHLQQLVH